MRRAARHDARGVGACGAARAGEQGRRRFGAMVVALGASGMVIGALESGAMAALAATPTSVPAAESRASAKGKDVVEPTPVGIEGRHILRVTGARAGSVMLAPLGERPSILVRVASTQREGEAVLYDLRYVGRRAGEFDLRQTLQYVDGAELADVEPVVVGIKSMIPDDHDLLMVELKTRTPSMTPTYTLALIVVGTLWAAPLVVLGLRWIGRMRAKRPVPVVAALSLWDLLRPLLEKAARGELTVQERARLEMLALGAWIERLGLKNERHATVMERLREHHGASTAVDVLNGWLHAREPDVSLLREQLHLLAPPEPGNEGGEGSGEGGERGRAGAGVASVGAGSAGGVA